MNWLVIWFSAPKKYIDLLQITYLDDKIHCWVDCKLIKIFCLPNMKSASDEEFEKLLEVFSRRISIFVFKVESAGRDFENKNRDESKSFQKLFKFRIH